MKSTYKTAESQRRAVDEYRARTKGTPKQQKTIGITLTAAEVEEHRRIMAEHGTTPARVWRKAIEELKAQPIPQPEEGTPGTPGEPADDREDAPGDPGRE